jgi:hypothetical protein
LAVWRTKYQAVFPASGRIAAAIFPLACMKLIFNSP